MATARTKKAVPNTISEWAAIGGYYDNVQFDFAGGANPIYIGFHTDADATDGDLGWVIWKFTWVSGNPSQKRKKVGSWTGRAALFA
jgi:hypothetical protein